MTIKMLSAVVLCVAVLSLPAHAQPVSCKEDAHCSNGYYCETDARICTKCLSCEDLKREPPLVSNACIKSVAECGACINELVVDRRSGGDVNACVKPDSSPYEGTPSYVWLLIGIGVLLFSVLVVGIIVYLLRNPEIFKAAGSNQSSTVTARITTASAPEAPPPPYQPTYQPPSSFHYVDPAAYSEEEQLIKPPTLPKDTRETAGSQAARVFNSPYYVRDPAVPSAESPVYTESEMPSIHDEDTELSTWEPGGTTSNGDVNDNVVSTETDADAGAGAGADAGADAGAGAGVALPALLAAARDTTLVEHPAAKKQRLDSRESNYSYGDSSNNNYPRSPSPSQAGPPYSFITQITNVVQINTNK